MIHSLALLFGGKTESLKKCIVSCFRREFVLLEVECFTNWNLGWSVQYSVF